MTRLRWFEYFLAFFFFVLACLAIAFIEGCSGPAFESASLAVSPDDGGLSEDTLTGPEDARGPGLDATSGDTRGDASDAPKVSLDTFAGEAMPPLVDSHISDPWPADVELEPMPRPNCFVSAGGLSCCYDPNVPPIDCAAQPQAHHCEQCSP
jgi:hypothetical protein